ncbi:hypothetical protein BOTBODRAFT_41346 [Botryobasidium botryosum FD-172 SS1]|uniref:Pinin/SDK/MemA protein domain-containing protein n=1 Tax=Botryobasidium botryosum (strain FD-172 SS1) TaxID=930990 RepID=A0A067MWW5_BOTB1|nr:hypothetical protein BOTBODRAFT_41346 [Botryobasidium botryosum FD-172 SS1]
MKSIFGLVVGTLNKAKIEDKERNASEAAKKRQSIDARLQAKLSKEQNIIRKQDELKKDRINITRTLEDLAYKEGILRVRHANLPYLSSFLLTTDDIPSESDSSTSPSSANVPPLYYLPAILTPSQKSFLERKRTEAEDRVQKEKDEWEGEKTKGLEEVKELRKKVAQGIPPRSADVEDTEMRTDDADREGSDVNGGKAQAMETEAEAVDEEARPAEGEDNTPPDETAHAPASSALMAMDQDDDDAVEY